MWHLIKSELLRFRTVAIALTVGVLLLLRGSMAIYPLFAADAAKTSITLLVCVVLGLSLGLYQFGSYRPSGQWTYLIHRPLGPKRIFLALAAAGLCLIFFVLILPLLLITAYLELAGSQWVDSRHYLLGPYLFGLTAAFYLSGAFIVLSRSKAAFLAVGITVFFLTREAEGAWIFVPQILVLLWLGFLCLAAFKPDLSTHVRKPWAVAAGTLALGYAFFWATSLAVGVAYSMGVIVKEHGIFGLSTFAWNDYFPPGTSEYVGYQNGRGVLAHGLDPEALAETGLDGEALANARHLQAQTALAEVFEVPGPRIGRYPVRHQLLFSDQRHELVDDEGETLWLFSHDLMLFQGIDVRSGEGVGWMGLDGPAEGPASAISAERRFPEVPVAVGDRFVVTRHRIYEVDFERAALDLRFELPADEVFTIPFVSADTFVVAISDRRFFLFEPRELARPTVLLEPIAAVELPGERRNVDRILVAELVDGYLATFVFGSWATRGHLPSEQVVVEAGVDGSSRVAALRPLEPGMPDIYRHRGFWISPFFQTAHDLAWTAIGPHRESRVTWGDTVSHPPPARMIALALLVALASAAAIALLAWRRGLGRVPSLTWAGGGLLLGLPALLAFLSLTARDEALGLPESTPAPRSAALPHLLGREGWNV